MVDYREAHTWSMVSAVSKVTGRVDFLSTLKDSPRGTILVIVVALEKAAKASARITEDLGLTITLG